MTSITRRAALAGFAATSAVAPAAALARQMHPLERLHALHAELPGLMTAHNAEIGGSWELRIRAAGDPCPIIYADVSVLTPMERYRLAVEELIAASKARYPEISRWRVIRDGDPCAGSELLHAMTLVVGHPNS